MTLVLIQAVAITIVGVLITVMPNVDNFYFMLMGLTGLVYLVAYLFMFSAAIYLRYKRPDVERSFRVPGGKLGMWICSGLGLAISLLAGYLGFIPPGSFHGSAHEYLQFQLIGLAVMVVIPFLVYAYGQRPSTPAPPASRRVPRPPARRVPPKANEPAASASLSNYKVNPT